MYMAGAMGQQAVLLLLPLYLERACDYTPFVAGCFLLIMTLFYSGSVIVGGKTVDPKPTNESTIDSTSIGCCLRGSTSNMNFAPMRIEMMPTANGTTHRLEETVLLEPRAAHRQFAHWPVLPEFSDDAHEPPDPGVRGSTSNMNFAPMRIEMMPTANGTTYIDVRLT